MDASSQHQMVVSNTFPSGAQEWYCPTCGRRFIMQLRPKYKRIIMEEGDEQAAHSGATGGLVMGDAQIEPRTFNNPDADQDQGQTDHDDPYLSPWERWMDDQDL